MGGAVADGTRTLTVAQRTVLVAPAPRLLDRVPMSIRTPEGSHPPAAHIGTSSCGSLSHTRHPHGQAYPLYTEIAPCLQQQQTLSIADSRLCPPATADPLKRDSRACPPATAGPFKRNSRQTLSSIPLATLGPSKEMSPERQNAGSEAHQKGFNPGNLLPSPHRYALSPGPAHPTSGFTGVTEEKLQATTSERQAGRVQGMQALNGTV